MISLNKVSKQYGKQLVFVDASFQLNPGEKAGLVGPNGAGKTTLFRMIVGQESPDDGDVSVPKKITIGYFRQDIEEMSGRSILDEAIAGSGRLGDLHHELEALQNAMSDPDCGDMDEVLERFGHVQEEYSHLGGYELEARAREVLHGLGFEDERIDGDVGALSGGWKMRVAMAKVLLGRPDVLLMDEPTNHLDIESILWLEDFLKGYAGSLLMTSHDREFMNRIVSKIVEIDEGDLVTYSGNYDFYERERALRDANQEAAYARQQAKLAKEQRFIERFSAHAAKAAQVQSRVKALDKIEKLEPPKRRKTMKFDFRTPPRSGDDVVALQGVSKAFGRRRLYDEFSFLVRRGERWCVMGKNGAGKSTLLKMGSGALEPDAGSVRLGASLKMGYFAQQSLDLLDPNLTVWEQIQKDFARERRHAAQSPRRVPVRRRRRGEESALALGRRALAPPPGPNAPRSAQLPGPRRADEPSRPGHEGDAGRGPAELRRHDALRLPRPHVPPRPLQPRPRARRPATPLRRVVRRIRRGQRPRSAGGARVTPASPPALRATQGFTRGESVESRRLDRSPRQRWRSSRSRDSA
jgi:ATPase subunit of ABC transporter with duplicated ATPase domains